MLKLMVNGEEYWVDSLRNDVIVLVQTTVPPSEPELDPDPLLDPELLPLLELPPESAPLPDPESDPLLDPEPELLPLLESEPFPASSASAWSWMPKAWSHAARATKPRTSKVTGVRITTRLALEDRGGQPRLVCSTNSCSVR